MFDTFLTRLKHFDAYPKPLEDFRVRTFTGALITFICSISVCLLFYFEWRTYMSVEIDQELFVDMSRNQKLTINLNVTFPHLPCQLLSLDAMDITGETRSDVVKGLKKTRLDSQGRVITETTTTTTTTVSNSAIGSSTNSSACLSCYGAESSAMPCCQTCDDVRVAYRHRNWHFSPFNVEQCKKDLEESGINMQASVGSKDTALIEKLLATNEGCQLAGHLEVNKVAGNFHVAPGFSFEQNHMHFHDIKNMPIEKFNTKHYFSVFSFGDEYPNQINPLELKALKAFQSMDIDKAKRSQQEKNVRHEFVLDGFINLNDIFGMLQQQNDKQEDADINSISFNYYLKVVPTTFEYLNGKIVNNTYQYSVTKNSAAVRTHGSGRRLPGIFVNYELSPIMVKYFEKSKPFSHFLTGCCAIIGGLFTIAGMFDAFTYRYYNMYKKYQLNKLT